LAELLSVSKAASPHTAPPTVSVGRMIVRRWDQFNAPPASTSACEWGRLRPGVLGLGSSCRWLAVVQLDAGWCCAVGETSARCSVSCLRPRAEDAVGRWSCAASRGLARRRCSSTRLTRRRTCGSCAPWGSSRRWSWPSPRCISCARRCSTASIGFPVLSATRSRPRSASAPARCRIASGRTGGAGSILGRGRGAPASVRGG
jgi:hypothetical protein